VRCVLAERSDVIERRMFGGLCFLVGGSMSCGIVENDLMVRVGPDAHAAAMAARHTRPMDFTGKPIRGFVYVAPQGLRTAAALRKWVALGVDFAVSAVPTKRRKTASSRLRTKAQQR
jgi:TfoX/Sxy family transcriptional regulator of competence genes